MTALANGVLPILVLAIIGYGLVKKVPVFDVFLKGAKEGVRSTVALLPLLVGFIMAVSMLRASGVLDGISLCLQPVADALHFPSEVIPLLLIHPVSGSGATAVFHDLLGRYGADSFIGNVASVICGSGESTFYTVAVYYGSVGIKETRHTFPVALLADFLVGVVSLWGVAIFMN